MNPVMYGLFLKLEHKASPTGTKPALYCLRGGRANNAA